MDGNLITVGNLSKSKYFLNKSYALPPLTNIFSIDELLTILNDLPVSEREQMLDFFIKMQPFDQLKNKYSEIKGKVL